MRFDQDRSAHDWNQREKTRPCVSRLAAIRRSWLALAVTGGLSLASGSNNAAAEGVKDVVLGSGAFQIPFNIANGGSPPREVQLYIAASAIVDSVVTPAGQWRLLDRQAPNVGQFQLSETPEGTFWFATRTIDSTGRPHPPGPIEPELKVTVDTSEPVVELVAEASAEGKVAAEFIVDDATGADQMTVHYVTDVTRQWQTATIDRTARGGRFAFQPDDRWQELSLRLRVLDRAGNEVIVTKRVQKPRIATTNPNRFASAPSFPHSQAESGIESGAPSPDEIPDFGTNAQPSAQLAATPFGFSSPFGFGGSAHSGAARGGAANPTAVNSAAVNSAAVNPAGLDPRGLGPRGSAIGSGRLAGNSDALPPPSSADQISQDFGRAAQGFESGQDLPGIEMLPDARASVESLPAPTPEMDSRPQTAAEAMRPLNTPAPPTSSLPRTEELIGPAKPSETSAEPAPTSVAKPAQNSSDLTPETSFQTQPGVTEMIPSPSGQPPAPTQLNRPGLESGSLDRDDADGSDPAPSPWSVIDSNRSANPSRSFSRNVPTEVQRRPPVEDGRTTVSRARSSYLNLDELAERSVVRHSDSRQFSLDYEIEAIGGRGVDAIELYGTTDGGQTWKRWGNDPDRVSPFDIETNGEGIFGFNIVVVAANGLASPSPLPGDVPDIVVVVDETEPEVSISGARYGEGDRAGSLVIQYRCQDGYLMSRPITLAFSDSPDGPWTTIAAGLRNLGDYVWPADPQLPRQIYLRIDATDQAGNVGGFVLEEPIDTRGLAPRARIRAFRSIPTN